MGNWVGSGPETVDYYVHQYYNASSSVHIKKFLLSNKTPKNPFCKLVSEKDENQKIIVLSINLEYTQNFTPTNAVVEIHNLFDIKNPYYIENQDVQSTFDTGTVSITCVGNYDDEIQEQDKVLYKSKKQIETKTYAGLIDLVVNLEEREHIFEKSHPIIMFLKQYENVLDIGNEEIFIDKSKTHIRIKDSFIKRAKELFINEIYRNIKETRFSDTEIDFKGQDVEFILEMEYILVNPSNSLKRKEIKF